MTDSTLLQRLSLPTEGMTCGKTLIYRCEHAAAADGFLSGCVSLQFTLDGLFTVRESAERGSCIRVERLHEEKVPNMLSTSTQDTCKARLPQIINPE